METKNEKVEQVEIKITWLNTRPVKYWFNDKLVWSADEDAVVNITNSAYDMSFTLNLLEAVRFSVIFINGISAANITNLLAKVNTKLAALNVFKDIMLLEGELTCGDCETCEDKDSCPAYDLDDGDAIDDDEDEDEDDDVDDDVDWEDELDNQIGQEL